MLSNMYVPFVVDQFRYRLAASLLHSLHHLHLFWNVAVPVKGRFFKALFYHYLLPYQLALEPNRLQVLEYLEYSIIIV